MGRKEKTKRKDGRELTTSSGTLPYRTKPGRLEVLLIKQFSHKETWGMPKGHLKKGEDIAECARRETFEETGIMVELDRRLPDCYAVFKDEHKTIVSHLARPCDPDIEPNVDDPDCEVADARWFSVTDLPNINAYQRDVIVDAVTWLMINHAQ